MVAHRRQRTGNLRRRPVREVSTSTRDSRSLPSLGISVRNTVQLMWARQHLSTRHIFGRLFILRQIQRILQAHLPGLPLLHLQYARMAYTATIQQLFTFINHYATTDYFLSDVHNETPADYGPERNRRINDFNDEDLRLCTRFNMNQLQRLLILFDLPIYCEIPLSNNKHYNMHREEILLFSLTKIAHGINSSFLCLMYFGGYTFNGFSQFHKCESFVEEYLTIKYYNFFLCFFYFY